MLRITRVQARSNTCKTAEQRKRGKRGVRGRDSQNDLSFKVARMTHGCMRPQQRTSHNLLSEAAGSIALLPDAAYAFAAHALARGGLGSVERRFPPCQRDITWPGALIKVTAL